jgi:hypothetical protein
MHDGAPEPHDHSGHDHASHTHTAHDGGGQDEAARDKRYFHEHHLLVPGSGMLAFDAFGVPVVVSAPDPILPRVEAAVPPGSTQRPPLEGDEYFRLVPSVHGEFVVAHGRDVVSGSADLGVALAVLASRIREHVALSAPHHFFVHAGVVGHEGRAIVIPGLSFSGKTTLVAELVRAGATYYSDEFAVLDEDGLVHPYPKPLSIRSGGYEQTDHAAEAFGGTVGTEPLVARLVVISWYERDGKWDPRRLSPGEATLALMANTMASHDRPKETLAAITKAVRDAEVLESRRGDAAAIVDSLLSLTAAAR